MIVDEDGVRYFICERRDELTGEPLEEYCACGVLATKLCDGAASPGKTCDAPICDECATTIGETDGGGLDVAAMYVTFCRQARRPHGTTLKDQQAYKASKIKHRDALRAVMDEGDTIDLCRACESARRVRGLIASGSSIP